MNDLELAMKPVFEKMVNEMAERVYGRLTIFSAYIIKVIRPCTTAGREICSIQR